MFFPFSKVIFVSNVQYGYDLGKSRPTEQWHGHFSDRHQDYGLPVFSFLSFCLFVGGLVFNLHIHVLSIWLQITGTLFRPICMLVANLSYSIKKKKLEDGVLLLHSAADQLVQVVSEFRNCSTNHLFINRSIAQPNGNTYMYINRAYLQRLMSSGPGGVGVP
jgi:hypothetical protein